MGTVISINRNNSRGARPNAKGPAIVYDFKDTFQGMKIIHKGGRICGGVYLSEPYNEAVIVDPFLPGIKGLYQKAQENATRLWKVRNNLVLKGVYDAVSSSMSYDREKAMKIIKEAGAENRGKIQLDSFINEGAGMSRHMALACGSLLELFKNEGHLAGYPGIQRKNIDETEASIWAEYIPFSFPHADRFILDVLGNYMGPMKYATTKASYMNPDYF